MSDQAAGNRRYHLLANIVAVLHFAFVAFALAGGFFVRDRPILRALHILAVAWSFCTLAFDWGCPLTPMEKRFRATAGAPAFEEGFIQHYILRTSYTEQKSRAIHIFLAVVIVAINVLIYKTR